MKGSDLMQRLIITVTLFIATTAVALSADSPTEQASRTAGTVDKQKDPDPIDRLVEKLSNDGAWQNGLSPITPLPPTTQPYDIIREYFSKVSWPNPKGQVKDFKIIKIKKVKIRGSLPDEYSAALIDSANLGRSIVIFQYQGNSGWFIKVYDAKLVAEMR